jgi:hypothetical protein
MEKRDWVWVLVVQRMVSFLCNESNRYLNYVSVAAIYGVEYCRFLAIVVESSKDYLVDICLQSPNFQWTLKWSPCKNKIPKNTQY